MTEVENFFISWGGTIWGWVEGTISAKLSTGEATGKLGQSMSLVESFESTVCNFIR